MLIFVTYQSVNLAVALSKMALESEKVPNHCFRGIGQIICSFCEPVNHSAPYFLLFELRALV